MPPNLGAKAEMINAQGKKVGNALFITTKKGLEVQVNLSGFESAANSEHAVHVHQMGKCQPTFDAAGDHFSSFDRNHSYLSPNGPHAGDLPNIWVEANGNAAYSYTTNLITLKEGTRAILDGDGAALVVHAQPDDYLTDPSGSADDPIACGAITINFDEEGVVERLNDLTGGEGPEKCIDAVGLEAHATRSFDWVYDRAKQMVMMESDRPHVLREMIYVCHPAGGARFPASMAG